MQELQRQNTNAISNLLCKYCNKLLDQPATVIPCGHTFCLGCKQAYRKNICYVCGEKKPFDAVYRNELLDELFECLDLKGYLK